MKEEAREPAGPGKEPETRAASGAEAEDARIVRAKQEVAAGNIEGALQLYRKVLLDRPRDAGIRLTLGELHEAQGDPHLAIEHYEAARDAEPDNIDALILHANALATLGRFDPAERALRRALRMGPSLPAVHTALGIINFRRGVYAQAEQDLRRAIDLDPDSAAAYHYRGESLNQLGRVDEALTMLERAAQLAPDHARTFYVMGILFDKKSRPQDAAAMYRKAREITAA